MSKPSLLQQVRGSLTNFEPLTEKNLAKLAQEDLTLAQIREMFESAGLDAGKIIVAPDRVICNAYYADYESGLYFEIWLSRKGIQPQCERMRVRLKNGAGSRFLEKREWKSFYCIDVPTPLRIMDFQKRYRTIEPERVFEVWAYIHQNMDYVNGQWKPEVLKYVFDHAPKVEGLPVNENGMVTLYRGSGTLSQRPEEALSWTTNRINALWFANHNGMGQAVYQAEIPADKVIAYFAGYQNENEIVVYPNTVVNIRTLDMFPVKKELVEKLLVPALPDFLRYGPLVQIFGYPSEGIFNFHGKNHILRVLLLSLMYFYNSGEKLNQQDKEILIYFSLLHDIGRTNDHEDDSHGKKSVRYIEENNVEVPEIKLSGRDKELAHLIIRYHSRPDEDGYAAIKAKRKLSREGLERCRLLLDICKDMDGLDRVRFHGLDFAMLRTDYAKKLPLIAGALLEENIEEFLKKNGEKPFEHGKEENNG